MFDKIMEPVPVITDDLFVSHKKYFGSGQAIKSNLQFLILSRRNYAVRFTD